MTRYVCSDSADIETIQVGIPVDMGGSKTYVSFEEYCGYFDWAQPHQ